MTWPGWENKGRHKSWAPSFGPLGLGDGTAQVIGYVKERYPEVAQNCAFGVAFHSGRPPFARNHLPLGIISEYPQKAPKGPMGPSFGPLGLGGGVGCLRYERASRDFAGGAKFDGYDKWVGGYARSVFELWKITRKSGKDHKQTKC
jgi:hypothetical protein